MSTVILLVAKCQGVCPPSWFEAQHPTVTVDHVRNGWDALHLISYSRPDFVVLGPGAPDLEEFRKQVGETSPSTVVGLLPCSAAGENAQQCISTRKDFFELVKKIAPVH